MNKWKLIVFLFVISLFSCENREEGFVQFLTNDSVALWDNHFSEKITNKERVMSYKFYKNGRCERYSISVVNGERIAQYSDRPQWELINDSIIELLCYEKYKIISYSKDTIVLKWSYNDRSGIETLVKVKESWNSNMGSVIRRDSLEVALKGRDNPCVIY